jgi:hypothetical protein
MEWDMWEFGRASDDEALELVVAFLRINEPERRREIVQLAKHHQQVSIQPLPKRTAFAQDNAPQQRGEIADEGQASGRPSAD